MDELDTNEVILQSFFRSNGKEYKVSTMNRNCSSPYAHGHIYAETLVFCDGEIVEQTGNSKDSIKGHLELVNQFFWKEGTNG
jgi:hypothetical protein